MTVYVPGPLRSYTGNRSAVEAQGSTLAAVLEDLDRRYPGMRFRMIDEQGGIRQHIKLFVNQEQVERLDTALVASSQIHIICAISGGRVRDIEVETSERLIPSRDRKGADSYLASKLFCNEQRHGIALLVDDVLKSMPYIFVLP